MNRYSIRYESGVEGDVTTGLWPKIRTEEVEANRYETKATQGAGLVADFFMTQLDPVYTFAKVHSVRMTARL